MSEQIKNQFNQSTLNNPVFKFDGYQPPPKQITTAGAAVTTDFMGRERELGEIRQRLTAGSGTLALLNAEGGMGKTTLAAAYWKRHQHAYQHLAWLFCESGILTALRSHLPEPLGLREQMNAAADNPEQQLAWIVARMANLPKDSLLVLDNANEDKDIRAFEQHAAGLGWHVLITSRCSNVLTDRNAEYPITSLAPDEARSLFRKYHDEPQNPEFSTLLDGFLRAVGHNTLCIELFGKHLREAAPWGQTLAQLLGNIEQKGLQLGANGFEVRTQWAQTQHSSAATTDQVIAALYDLDTLAPEAQDLLTQCCLLPAESHAAMVWAALLAPDDPRSLKTRLDALVQKGWLNSDTATYRVSPVVQRIVLARQQARLWELGEPIVKQLHTIFETEGYHSKNIKTAGPFAELVFELVDNLGVANGDIAMLFDRLWVFYTATGNLSKAMDTAERMRVVSEKYGDKNGLAISYEKLGSTHTALGNLPPALTFFEEYNRLKKELHEAYPQNVDFKNGLAISYEKLGSTHTALGNLPQALTFFEKDIELTKELHEAYPQNVSFKNGLAISYEKLGSTHTALGNLPQALTFFEEYNSLEKELHEAYPQNVDFKNGLAISYSKLGSTHKALGNLPQALTFFEQFNQLMKELHEAYPQNVDFKNNLAISYLLLGQFHRDQQNDKDTARAYFQKGYELYAALVRDFPDYVGFRGNYEWVKEALGTSEGA
jgi:tetratricopeptide (TPR) repeat protein